MYKVVFTKRAAKDIPNLKRAKLDDKVKALIEIVKINPFQNPPPYEKIVGDFLGAFSRRINIKHRFVYEVIEEEKVVKIISMWSQYEH